MHLSFFVDCRVFKKVIAVAITELVVNSAVNLINISRYLSSFSFSTSSLLLSVKWKLCNYVARYVRTSVSPPEFKLFFSCT